MLGSYAGPTKYKKQAYMREHSKIIRGMTRNSHESLEEDPVISRESETRPMIVVMCRSRQRKLQNAWNRWSQRTGVIHDYHRDVMAILSRPLPPTELRTELEVEVFFKWVLQDYTVDPTGIAYTLYMCKSKRRIVNLIQHARLDRYAPGEPILLQNAVPLADEGLLTLLQGSVDIVILPRESEQVVRLQNAKKLNDNDEIRRILTNDGVLADSLQAGAGFGELSALTKVRRASSIVASEDGMNTDLLVVTAQDLVDCLDKRRKINSKGAQVAPAEVMDFLRQTGLVHKAPMADVLQVASCIVKKVFSAGTLLYRRGERVDMAYIVLSGEIFLDLGEFDNNASVNSHFVQGTNPSNCYVLGSGSILGDEGMIGHERLYDASAVVLSENSIVFEITGFGISFLGGRLGVEKYSALLYKDKSIEAEPSDVVMSEIVLHSTFNCLRKVISVQNPYRNVNRPVYKDGDANFVINKKCDKKSNKTSSLLVQAPVGEISNSSAPAATPESVSKKSKVINLHPGGVSTEGHKVLSSGAMHRLHFIRRGLRHRELMAMRGIAERAAVPLYKAKMEKMTTKSSSARHHSSSIAVAKEYSNTAIYRDNLKYRRAMDNYLKRKELEFGEEMMKLENEELSVIQSLHLSQDGESNDFFQLTASQIVDNFESNSQPGSVCSNLRSLPSYKDLFASSALSGIETKLEKYFKVLASKNKIASTSVDSSVRRFSKLPSFQRRGSTTQGGRRPTLVKSPSNIVGGPSSETLTPAAGRDQSPDSFFRVATPHTVGIYRPEDLDDKTRIPRFTRGGTSPLLDESHILSLQDKEVVLQEKSKTDSEKEYDKKLLKFLDVAQEYKRGYDEVSRGEYGISPKKSAIAPPKTSQSGRKFLEVHSRQQSLKSSSRDTIGTKLLRKASLQLEGDDDKVTVKKRSMTDVNIDISKGELSLKKKLGIAKWNLTGWNLTGNDITEVKIKENDRARVLQEWQEMIDSEPIRSSHQDGRQKAIATSEHRSNTERDRIKSEAEIEKLSIPGVTQDMKDLLRWKQYCAQEVLEIKHGPRHSMPTLAKQGSNAYLGRKMIINTVDRPHTAPHSTGFLR